MCRPNDMGEMEPIQQRSYESRVLSRCGSGDPVLRGHATYSDQSLCHVRSSSPTTNRCFSSTWPTSSRGSIRSSAASKSAAQAGDFKFPLPLAPWTGLDRPLCQQPASHGLRRSISAAGDGRDSPAAGAGLSSAKRHVRRPGAS